MSPKSVEREFIIYLLEFIWNTSKDFPRGADSVIHVIIISTQVFSHTGEFYALASKMHCIPSSSDGLETNVG